MAQARSTSLFHFTKSVEALKGILRGSFHPNYALEDVRWFGLAKMHRWAFPMVCFCDIPLGRIQDHAAFYGHFGIGLSRDWAIRNGLNPVFYLSPSSPIGRSFFVAFRAAVEANPAPLETLSLADIAAGGHLEQIDLWGELEKIVANIKPLSGIVTVAGAPVEKNFYLESEWRYVPRDKKVPVVLTEKYYENKDFLDQLNKLLREKAPLRYTPQDVHYIFVKSDADIPPLVDFMYANLGGLSVADMKILITRITSLEHVGQDA